METDAELKQRLMKLLSHLDERQKRLYLASEALRLGHGGVVRISRVMGLGKTTLFKAIHELDEPPLPIGYARRAGAGRKRLEKSDPQILAELEELLHPETGDPTSPLKWTCRSTRELASALTEKGHALSHEVVAQMLRKQGYRLHTNVKVKKGKEHPDRHAQFQYINQAVKQHLDQGWPVISVDSKKKALIGSNTDDLPATPCGIYNRKEGRVKVGRDHNTAAFAVEGIRRWWATVGKAAHPRAERILVCADGGGSKGYRIRVWKLELSRWAQEAGLIVTVCHVPPGTSKWSNVEHRFFSHIGMKWSGQPLESHEVVVQLISGNATSATLVVRVKLENNFYPRVRVRPSEVGALPIEPHEFHGGWNYRVDHSPRQSRG